MTISPFSYRPRQDKEGLPAPDRCRRSEDIRSGTDSPWRSGSPGGEGSLRRQDRSSHRRHPRLPAALRRRRQQRWLRLRWRLRRQHLRQEPTGLMVRRQPSLEFASGCSEPGLLSQLRRQGGRSLSRLLCPGIQRGDQMRCRTVCGYLSGLCCSIILIDLILRIFKI